MSDQTDKYQQKLIPYGLSTEESCIYIYLLKASFCTALQISRDVHIARTKVYRILDNLIKQHLVEEKLGERGREFGAANPKRLQELAYELERKVNNLVTDSTSLVSQLELLIPNTFKKSKVLYYEGVEGLKQVAYNTVHTKGIMRVYEVEHMSEFLDTDYSDDIRQKYVERKIFTRDLTNKKNFPAFTKIAQYVKQYSEFRYIPPELLTIQFESLIYNDVYATYTYKGTEIFCVEIYNEQLAQMQKQMFDFIWNQAKSMKYTDLQGTAVVESKSS